VTSARTKEELLARIDEHRAYWRQLVAEVGEDRMEEPGPMGDWTFKDLAAHLTFWRDWSTARIEAGPGAEPPPIWPANLTEYDPHDPDETDWDPINAWVYAQHHDRSVPDVLADADASFDRLKTAIESLPEQDVMEPGRFSWLGDYALADADFGGHLHEEHEPSVRAWLNG
jgi:hypothetical protein